MDEAALIELNKRIGAAERKRDREFLDGVLADELVFKRASGAVVTKEEYLSDLMKTENRYEYLYAEDVKAVQNGDVAYITLLVCARGWRGKTEFGGVFRNQRIFVREHGNWKCRIWVNSQVS